MVKMRMPSDHSGPSECGGPTGHMGHFMQPGVMNKGHNTNWIAGAIKHPGALHKELGVPQGQKIPAGKLAAAAKKGGTLGRRARLAQTLAGLHK